MENKYIGPGAKDLTTEEIKNFETKRGIVSIKKHPSEFKKTREEKELINSVAEVLYSEMRSLGLEPKPFPLKALHLLPKHFYWYPGLKNPARGSYSASEDRIELDISRKEQDKNRPNILKRALDYIHQLVHVAPISYLSDKKGDARVLFHELIHSQSKVGFYVNEEREVDSYKSGFSTSKKEDMTENKMNMHFFGLNEAVTDKLARELLLKNHEKIFTKKEFEGMELFIIKQIVVHGYTDYIVVLDKIINTIAEFEYKEPSEVWNDIKKKYFKGELMYFRKIEDMFGIGSLRVLAAMDKTNKTSKNNSEKQLKIEKYFSSGTTFAERERLAKEILDESEYGRFERHQQIINARDKFL